MSKKQIGKRLLQILIVLIGVSFFTFGLTYLSPGDGRNHADRVWQPAYTGTAGTDKT